MNRRLLTMRKWLHLLLLLSLALSLVSCGGRIVRTEEEILEIITKELDLEGYAQIIDTIVLDDVVLACYMTGNEYQAHTYGFTEFKKVKDGYKFLKTHSTMERGMDLCSAMYDDSYLFISNNQKSQSLRIRFDNEREELVAIDKIPFVYYLDNATNFEYHFLDEDGKELWP